MQNRLPKLIKGVVGALPAVALSAIMAATGWSPRPAHAQGCTVFDEPAYKDGEIVWEPQVHCEGQSAPPQHFAAIAVSDATLSWGSSWGAASREQAEQMALASCGQRASDCKAVDWARYRCIALAVSLKDHVWGVDDGDYPETAAKKALAQCRAGGGGQCVVITHPCSED
jgi:hypothetical protein